MLKTFLGVLRIILALFLIIFGIYVYIYLKSRKTVKLEKNHCTSSCDKNNNDICIVWNEVEQKCYPGVCQYDDTNHYCSEWNNNKGKNSLEEWQKNVLMSSSIVFGLCVISYFFKE